MSTEGICFSVLAPTLGPDPRNSARLSRELGFAGLQFETRSGTLDLIELSASGRRELLRTFSQQEQQLVGLRGDLGPAGFGLGADVDRVLARLDQVMETAAGLGTNLVCIDAGPLPTAPVAATPKPAVTALEAGLILLPESMRKPAPPPPPVAPPPDPGFVSQVNAALAELGRHADRYSIVIAFRSELASFASLELALRQVACPWFGVDFDPVSLLRDEWDVDEFFSRLGPLTRHVRGHDAVRGADRRTKPAVVGQGNVPWEAVLANLDDAGYRGWVTLDSSELTDRVGAARAGLKYLRSLVE